MVRVGIYLVHLLICVVLVLSFWKLLDCEDAPFVIRTQLGKDSQAVSCNGYSLQLRSSIELSEKCFLKSDECCMPHWSSSLLLAAIESNQKLRENTGTADANLHVQSSLWVNSYMISQQELWKSKGSRQSCLVQSDEFCVFHLNFQRLYTVWLGQLTPQEDGVEGNEHKRDQQEDKQEIVGKNEPQSHTRIRHCTDWQRLLAGSMERNRHDGDQQEHRTLCDNTKTCRLQNFFTFFGGGCLHHEDM